MDDGTISPVMDDTRDPPPDDFESERSALRRRAGRGLDADLRSRVDPSDVVQQALLEALRAAGGFRGQTAAERRAWLGRILDRQLAHLRRDQRRARRDPRRERALGDSPAIEPAESGTSPSAALDRAEQARRLADVLSQLPRDRRDALVLRYLHGLSLAQVAQVLGRSEPAVVGLIQRGLQQLRGLMGPSEESGP